MSLEHQKLRKKLAYPRPGLWYSRFDLRVSVHEPTNPWYPWVYRSVPGGTPIQVVSFQSTTRRCGCGQDHDWLMIEALFGMQIVTLRWRRPYCLAIEVGPGRDAEGDWDDWWMEARA